MLAPFRSTYPPETHFLPGLGEAELRAAILRSNEEPIPRQLALSVRIPVGTTAENRGDITRLRREIDLVARLVDRDRDAVTLRLDVQDAAQWPPLDAVRELSDALHHQFHFAPEAISEFSFEGDPLTLDLQQVDALATAGFSHANSASPSEAGSASCGPATHGECDELGFGPGAISCVGGWLSQSATDLPAWRGSVDRGQLPARRGLKLTPDDELRGDVIRHLWTHASIEISRLERTHEIRFRDYFASELARLAPAFKVGAMRDLGDRIEVCSFGWPWLRSVALCFDAYSGEAGHPREVATGHRH